MIWNEMPDDFLPDKFLIVAEHGDIKLAAAINSESIRHLDKYVKSLRESVWNELKNKK